MLVPGWGIHTINVLGRHEQECDKSVKRVAAALEAAGLNAAILKMPNETRSAAAR